MQRASTRVVLTCLLLCTLAAAQKKIKVIADQDSAGPQGTNFLCCAHPKLTCWASPP
jgi:hypothetical protein